MLWSHVYLFSCFSVYLLNTTIVHKMTESTNTTTDVQVAPSVKTDSMVFTGLLDGKCPTGPIENAGNTSLK